MPPAGWSIMSIPHTPAAFATRSPRLTRYFGRSTSISSRQMSPGTALACIWMMQWCTRPALFGHRVFNGGWRFGGRLYGPFWQNLNKQRRLQLTLDGTRVVEHDFAQLHP